MSVLQFLLLENNLTDGDAIQAILSSGNMGFEMLRVDSRADFVTALEAEFDLILAGGTPGFDGIAALEVAQSLRPGTPFIFVSAGPGEELAIEALDRGATDYVLKQWLGRLVPSVQRALREAQERRDRRQAEQMLIEQQQLLEMIALGKPLDTCLAAICATVARLDSARACFLLTDAQRLTFPHAITPSFPPTFKQHLKDAPIDHRRFGTCGEAVYRREPVTCADIANDNRWSQEWREVCLAHGILACHSKPVIGIDGLPLGSLMLCFDQARMPTDWEYQLAEFGTRIASVVFERDRAGLMLRESEAEYRRLFESIDQGFCVVEVLLAESTPIDYRVLSVNPVFEQQSGIRDVVGKTARQLNLEDHWIKVYGQVALTGESVRFENGSETLDRWFDVYAYRMGAPELRKVAIVFKDISERKRAENLVRRSAELNAFRISLADALRPLADPIEIQATASRVLGASLGVNRVVYFEMRGAYYVVEQDYVNGAAALTGSYPIDAFGAHLPAAFRMGHTITLSDVATEPSLSPEQRFAYAALRIGAHITIPLVKNGEFVAGLAVHSSQPRVWTADEILLAEEVAERTWAAVERARTEAALQQSEARFRRIFESKMVPMGIWTSAGGIIEANDALLDLIGYTKQEMATGQVNWRDLTPSEYQALDEFALGEIATQGFSTPFEKVYIHKDGREIPILLGGGSFKDDPHGGVFFAIDQTDRKRIEAALRESEMRLRFMLDASQIGEWDLDLTTQPHTAHRSLIHDQIFGYESLLPEWSYEIFLSHVHPDDRAAVDQQFQQTVSASTSWNFECRIIHPDQSVHWIWVRSSVYCNSDGTPTRLLGIVIDITDRKQAEVALQAQTQLTQIILASIGDGLIVANLQGEFVLFNQAAEGIFGRLNNEQPCEEWSKTYGLFLPDQQTVFSSQDLPLYRAIQGEYTNDVEVFVQRDVSVGRWVSISGFPVRDSKGDITGGVITCRDVSERKRILQQEQAAREEAERANRLKDEFLAVLSHELRSPLNPILGWTRLLQTGNLDETRRVAALEIIERNAKLQAQLIEDLLDIARIMQSKLSLTAAPVNLTYVISAAVETVRLAAEARNVGITLDLDAEVAPISGDTGRLQQVIWNLLSNAVKFTPNGGQVAIELRQLDHLAQIRVIDTGKGIDPQFLPHVFEYFRQEDGSTTRQFGGLGLGLAIVRQIVEMHGGTVQAESLGENQGASFTVQLPTVQIALTAPEPTDIQANAETPLANVQILLVDDETDTREFQAFLLEQNGAQVTAVTSGWEALQALERFVPDIIISDIGMAEMDGYMLLEQIRSRLPNQNGTIPVIALTAYAAEADKQRALQAGFQAYITKPIESEGLIKKIVMLIS